MDNWWLAASLWPCACSCISSPAEFFDETSNQHPNDSAPYSPDLVPCNFWLFSKLKSPLKVKRFQIANEIQENMTEQLIRIRRNVWGPKVPNLKGTDELLSHVQSFLYLISSLINVSIFHGIWLNTFWADFIEIYLIFVCYFYICLNPTIDCYYIALSNWFF